MLGSIGAQADTEPMKLKTLADCKPGDLVYLRPASNKYEAHFFARVEQVHEAIDSRETHAAFHGAIVPSQYPVTLSVFPFDEYGQPFVNVHFDKTYPGYMTVELVSYDNAAAYTGADRTKVRDWSRTPPHVDSMIERFLSGELVMYVGPKDAKPAPVSVVHPTTGHIGYGATLAAALSDYMRRETQRVNASPAVTQWPSCSHCGAAVTTGHFDGCPNQSG